MHRATVAIVLACTLTLGAAWVAAQPAPDPVRRAAASLFGKREVKISAEHENGTVVYEAAARTKIEAVFTAAGQLRETEIDVPVAVVPAAVLAGVKRRLPAGAVVREAEVILTRDGVRFEIEARTGAGKEIEYLVGADGTVVDQHQEADQDDEEDQD